jgi:hypothetical protein
MLSGIASLRGERVIDPETGMEGMPYDAFLSATTPLAVGRAVTNVPRASFGIFGSGGGKSGQQAEDTVAMLEESGFDSTEGWERQDGANTYKAYRSSLDGKVRYEIPTTNVAFRGAARETEDPDVELGKLLDPETRDEQRLLAMQGLRIRKNKFNDQDYLTVPGFFELDETQLNKYGFTKYDSQAGKRGLVKFPAPVLEQIIDFPELFDEYPQLRSIQIKPTPALSLFLKGAYNPETKEIFLASVPNTAEGRKEMMSTLLHEVQHAVQDIEGLYGGANTGMFDPAGFGERKRKNQDARKALDTEIGDSLDNLVVTLGDSPSKEPKTGLFSKMFGLDSPLLPPRTQKGLAGADQETDDGAAKVRAVKRGTVSYLRARAEEEEQIAAGEIPLKEKTRRMLEEDIIRKQERLRDQGASRKKIRDVETEYRGQAFRYAGSDQEMIYLAEKLKIAGVKNPEKVAERIADAFDDQIQKLRPVLKEKKQVDEINSRSYEMYAGNPGEVEARNVQRRFEGIEEGQYIRHPQGDLRRFPEKVTPLEMQTVDPEITQGMVLPEGGLVYSLAEGRKGQPSFSMDPPGNDDLETKKAKLQQQRSTYDNRNAQLFESTNKPLAQSTVDRLKAERQRAGREVVRLQHEIDLEENEPNLPDSIITRDSSGQLLPRNDFYQANEYAFHGTRGAADRIIEDGGVHMNTDEPAFFMVESPAEAMTYGAGGLGDLGNVIPMRIDTRGFAEIDYGGKSYGELDEGGVVSVAFPKETTFFGFKGTDFEVEVDFDDLVTVRVDGGKPTKVSEDLLEQYHPMGSALMNEEAFLNAVKDAGAPGARLISIRDLNPTGAMMLRGTTKLKIPEENEILTVFDKSRQRLAKGNPAKADDAGQIGIARNPFEGFSNGGMVNNMRRRNISGLTNLFSKYNTSGPLAGAGVPRGTMPVGMNQGGSPDFTDVPISVQRQVLSDLSRVPTMSPNTQGFSPVASEVPVAEQMPPAQTTTPLPTLTGGPTPITTDPLFSTAPALPPEAALPPSVYTPPAQTAVTVPTQPMFTTPLSAGPTPGNFDDLYGYDEEVDDSNFVFTQGRDRVGMPVVSFGPPQNVDPNRFISVEDFERGLTSSQPPDPYAVPAAPAPGMLSDAVVDFNISDAITPQTEGYATTRAVPIQATGDPFADAVEGEYQMALYRPTPTTAMPFLSLDFARPPTAPDRAPPPPQSDQYSTGSYGRLEFAEAVADYERRFGPVEDYTPPEPVMDDGENPETTTPGTTTPGTTIPGGNNTRFYPERPPTQPTSGGIGPRQRYRQQMEAWEAKYGPVEDYYAAQEAAQGTDINAYLSQLGEDAIAQKYGMTVEQLRQVNARRREQGLPPLGGVDLPDIGDIYR